MKKSVQTTSHLVVDSRECSSSHLIITSAAVHYLDLVIMTDSTISVELTSWLSWLLFPRYRDRYYVIPFEQIIIHRIPTPVISQLLPQKSRVWTYHTATGNQSSPSFRYIDDLTLRRIEEIDQLRMRGTLVPSCISRTPNPISPNSTPPYTDTEFVGSPPLFPFIRSWRFS